MKNFIAFINLCLVAGVALLVLDFGAEPMTATKQATMMPTDAALTTSADGSTKQSERTVMAAIKPAPSKNLKKGLSDKEAAFVNEFINEMMQARIMNLEEGKLAAQRSTLRSLKDYGSWMVLHQERMLSDLNKLATHHSMSPGTTLNRDLTASLSAMLKLHGKKFDQRVIKSMIAGQKRDLKYLERAAYSRDPEVQVFAARYTLIAKDNLSKLEDIKRQY